MSEFTVPERMTVAVINEIKGEVCQKAFDLNKLPSNFANDCMIAVMQMMDETEPSLPEIVQQYRALKAAGALRSQLSSKKKIPLGTDPLEQRKGRKS